MKLPYSAARDEASIVVEAVVALNGAEARASAPAPKTILCLGRQRAAKIADVNKQK